jgi:transcription elongation factor Elf1
VETRWKPHACLECEGRFEVGYPEQPEPVAWVETSVSCPHCGHAKTVSVPRGTERALRVEDEDADEGGGG